MIQRKPITWFLILSFAISWIFFLIPLSFKSNPAAYAQLVGLFWAVGMWGPGIAAIIVTLFVAKEPFSTLRLNKLGKFRYYLAAWFIPPLLATLTILLTIVIGTGKLDTGFTTMQQIADQTAASSGTAIPVAVLIAVQLLQGLILGPAINLFATMGEEIGWRGFLLPKLLPLGQWKAMTLVGVIWGIWHAPVILQGHNYPEHPYIGVLLMIIFCVLLSYIFSWLYLKARSPWVAGIAHGSINAWGGLPVVFLVAGFDTAWGGTIVSVTGMIVMALFVGLLILTKQLPVKMKEEPVVPLVEAPAE